jgi:hypothetical protein
MKRYIEAKNALTEALRGDWLVEERNKLLKI